MKKLHQPLNRFLLIFGLVYLGFMVWAPNSFIHDGLDQVLLNRCEKMKQPWYGKGMFVCDDQVEANDENLRIRVRLYNKAQNDKALREGTRISVANTFFNTRVLSLLPFGMLIALILASPVPWWRKSISIVVGSLVLYVVVLMFFKVQIAHEFHINPNIDVVDLPLWRATLYRFLMRVGTNNMVFAAIFPVFIWVILTFRKTDLEKWKKMMINGPS